MLHFLVEQHDKKEYVSLTCLYETVEKGKEEKTFEYQHLDLQTSKE